MLTGFNVSAVTMLQVLLIAVLQYDITPADRHDITLLYLPSQTASELQLTDKSVFDCNERF